MNELNHNKYNIKFNKITIINYEMNEWNNNELNMKWMN